MVKSPSGISKTKKSRQDPTENLINEVVESEGPDVNVLDEAGDDIEDSEDNQQGVSSVANKQI